MVIIRGLDENGRMIEPLNIKNRSEMYLRCMRNNERINDSIDYRLLEIGVFGSYESIGSSTSDSDSLWNLDLQGICF